MRITPLFLTAILLLLVTSASATIQDNPGKLSISSLSPLIDRFHDHNQCPANDTKILKEYPNGCKYKTIQAAVDAAKPGDTIFVAAGTYKENITIDKSLTIIGAGKCRTVIDGQQKGPVFLISNVTAKLCDMTIQNGHGFSRYMSLGGGIMNTGITTVESCIIKNNYAEDVGGGIFNYYDPSINPNASLIVKDSQFIGNSAQHDGGAIFNKGSLKVIDCYFENNSAALEQGSEFLGGGAIANVDQLTVSNSVFYDNSANSAGAMYNAGGGDAMISCCKFTENRAIGNWSSISGLGGAIFNGMFPGNCTIVSSIITANSAKVNGGGIYWERTKPTTRCTKIHGNTPNDIEHGTLPLNTTIVPPGTGTISNALSNASDGDMLLLEKGAYFDNVLIDKSISITGAGASLSTVNGKQIDTVFNINPNIVVTLSGMTITNGLAANGGGIYNEGTLNLNNVMITGNTATMYGGGIENDGSDSAATVNMYAGSSIASNSAQDGGGGGIYNVAGTVNMYAGSSITDNTVFGNGGGIQNYGGTVNLNGGSIAGNTAGIGGGIDNYGTVNLNSGSIAGNTAQWGHGGGIDNDGEYGTIQGTVNGNTQLVHNNSPNNIESYAS